MVKLAMHCDLAVAAAVFFVGKNTLYGRYWGARAEFHSLHFETCYYQGIEFCIERGLASFEPGTQGEHKIARGFEPSATFSAHWIADRRFNRAIGQYLAEETRAVEAYMDDVRQHLPYHRGVDVGS
jgi:predicted N-acyltransferase